MLHGRRNRLVGLLLVLALSVAFPAGVQAAELVIMATTDIHANIYPWDYYANQPSETVGLAKIYTLVKEIRAAHPNTLLVDNGDLFQGTPLASYLVNEGLPRPGDVHPIIDVLNRMGYDAAASATTSSTLALSTRRMLWLAPSFLTSPPTSTGRAPRNPTSPPT